MKKAKIILSLIAILAIGACVLSFKASRAQFVGWKTTTVYYIGVFFYTTNVPFCTATTTLVTLRGIENAILYRSTTTTAVSRRTVANGSTTFTITAPGCTTVFATITTAVEA